MQELSHNQYAKPKTEPDEFDDDDNDDADTISYNDETQNSHDCHI